MSTPATATATMTIDEQATLIETITKAVNEKFQPLIVKEIVRQIKLVNTENAKAAKKEAKAELSFEEIVKAALVKAKTTATSYYNVEKKATMTRRKSTKDEFAFYDDEVDGAFHRVCGKAGSKALKEALVLLGLTSANLVTDAELASSSEASESLVKDMNSKIGMEVDQKGNVYDYEHTDQVLCKIVDDKLKPLKQTEVKELLALDVKVYHIDTLGLDEKSRLKVSEIRERSKLALAVIEVKEAAKKEEEVEEKEEEAEVEEATKKVEEEKEEDETESEECSM